MSSTFKVTYLNHNKTSALIIDVHNNVTARKGRTEWHFELSLLSNRSKTYPIHPMYSGSEAVDGNQQETPSIT
jgi:hypothetical protein